MSINTFDELSPSFQLQKFIYHMQRIPCLFALHCVSVHDDEGHDEETEIHKYDNHHWYNERPHKVCIRVQPAPAE